MHTLFEAIIEAPDGIRQGETGQELAWKTCVKSTTLKFSC